MKRLALTLMLLVLPSTAWGATSTLECSSPIKGDRQIETFAWGGEHTTWSAINGLNIDEGWKVEEFYFLGNGVIVKLRYLDQNRKKVIMFNSGWICRSVWFEDKEEN